MRVNEIIYYILHIISNLIRQRDSAWSMAKQCNDPGNYWNFYRALRNKCKPLVKAAKSDHYLNNLNENLNDPCTFWKLVKSTEATVLRINQCEIKGKDNIMHLMIILLRQQQ